jgi:hypothetical protein
MCCHVDTVFIKDWCCSPNRMPAPRHHPSREAIDELGLRFRVGRPWNSLTIITPHLAWHRSQRTDDRLHGSRIHPVGRVRIKIHSCRQCGRPQQRTINCRQFALPGASVGLPIEKMIKSLDSLSRLVGGLAGCSRKNAAWSAFALPPRLATSIRARQPPDRRQRKAGGGNADRPFAAVLSITSPLAGFVSCRVVDCFVLKQVQFGLGG